MTGIKSDIDIDTNERIEDRIPDGLILEKSSDLSNRDITVYDLIAHYIGLRYLQQDIYTNESGEEFIRTKYGFQSAIRYNQNIQISESEKLIDELQYKLKIVKEKAGQYSEIIKVLEAKSRERKEKLKNLVQTFQAENETLRNEIKSLKVQLAGFKDTNGYVVGKLTKLINQSDNKVKTDKPISNEFDWSAYHDLLDDNEV